ncbi:hypothetical protein M422DRAFT_30019 [Sphaerobolus stellatus SS14]|uniref:Uncharacterized protein n=1 Tax=Sphaerobolus stellatus (strain SS14) TaxID=990650 RepID=A0A0C9VDN5_SPHS4|nr:hypothetical protein M422DRAFT_30019 [Sphaerobolus stellatus SS14]
MSQYPNGYYGPTNYAARKKERNNNNVAASGASYTNPYAYYNTPTAGYFDHAGVAAAALPPTTPVIPPARTTPYDYEYATAPYPPRYRRPSDPGPQNYEPKTSITTTRRGKAARTSEDIPGRSRTTAIAALPTTFRPARSARNLPRALSPDFMFVSLSSHDVLRICNLEPGSELEYDIDNLLRTHWRSGPAGHPEFRDGEWTVSLGGDVWTANGLHGIRARRLILHLFVILRQAGLGYLTTISTSHPFKAPRLVFTTITREDNPTYFMISFSMNHRTVHIIDAPADLGKTLSKILAAKPLPPKPSESDYYKGSQTAVTQEHKGVLEITTEIGTRGDLELMMSGVLKIISSTGWAFEASVPFGKCGLFGYKGRREVWMFRRTHEPEDSRYTEFEPPYPEERYYGR